MNSDAAGAEGGGLKVLDRTALISDCTICDNRAYDYAGCSGFRVTYERCQILRNKPSKGGIVGGMGTCYLSDGYVNGNGGAYQLLSPMKLVNVTFGSDAGGYSIWNQAGYGAQDHYNCVFLKEPSTFAYSRLHRCVLSWKGCAFVPGEGTLDADCRVVAPEDVGLAEDGRPLKGSPLVDAGSNAYLASDASLDVAGVPRVLGGCVDIGGFEYDWRRDFEGDLGGRLQVTAASSNVVETAEGAVRLADGQRVEVRPASAASAQKGRLFRFAVSGGTLTVSVNGAVVAAAESDGEWRYAGEDGDVISFEFLAAPGADGHADLLRTQGLSAFIFMVK